MLRSRSWKAGLVTTLGVLATALGVLASVGPGLKAIADAVTWILGDRVVLVLLLLSALLVLFLLLRARVQPNAPGNDRGDGPLPNDKVKLGPAHRAADKRTYHALIELITREIVRFLAEHDFGNSWSRDIAMPFFEYVDTRNDVEDQFLDPNLEAKRQAFHREASILTSKWARFGIWSKGNPNFYELAGSERIREEPPKGAHFERYMDRQQQLNEAAAGVVATYDDLVREARLRVP